VTEPVRGAVSDLPFVKDMQQVENTLVVSLDNPEEQNPILVERIVAVGGAIQFVTELRHSLEDIYFALVEEEDQA
jgi:ABC-2 type transport system ATP-binding protein